MSTTLLSSEEQLVRSYLQRALEDEESPSVMRLRMVQRFATETPSLFCNAALTLLDNDEDTSAHRFMVVKLLSQPQLMTMLADPSRFDRTAAVRLFKRLMRHDRGLDLRLAQTLPDRYGISDVPLSVPSCERALDLLDHVSEGRRIVPIVGHLVEHPAPWLSSKATLVVGRRLQSVTWVKRMLITARSNRDRANALESLWGLNTQPVRSLLWEHLTDRNNRVTGNAVLGLHIVGEPKAVATVRRMAQRNEPEFRWTSAWLMSKIQSPEHLEMLKRMVKDVNPGVRRAALRALVEIRQHEARSQAEELRRQLEAERAEMSAAAAAVAAVAEAAAAAADAVTEPPVAAETPAPEAEPEVKLIIEPEFNLRLDGRTFSFRDK